MTEPDLVVFTYTYNSFGHKAPVIYKIAKETDYSIDVVFTSSPTDWDEYIIDFIQKQDTVSIYTIGDYVRDAENTTIPFNLKKQSVNLSRIKSKLRKKIPYITSVGRKNILTELAANKVNRYQDPILIFDTDMGQWQRDLINIQNNVILLLPHGDYTFKNAISIDDFLKQISPSTMVNGEKREYNSCSRNYSIFDNSERIANYSEWSDTELYQYLSDLTHNIKKIKTWQLAKEFFQTNIMQNSIMIV
jgi:hypothetical protein